MLSMNVTNTGVSVVVPDDDVARLMYYLHCVTVGVGLDILHDDLVDYGNYGQLSPVRSALVVKSALEFSPDEFINKLIFKTTTARSSPGPLRTSSAISLLRVTSSPSGETSSLLGRCRTSPRSCSSSLRGSISITPAPLHDLSWGRGIACTVKERMAYAPATSVRGAPTASASPS
jgi:hypothetical protein